jgi:hypothetical protein
MSDRKSIRDKIFSAKPESQLIEAFGTTFELRQPSLAVVLDTQQKEDRKEQVAAMLVQFAYVPGTNEKVFEEGDLDEIINLPFNSDMQKIQNAIADLTGAVVTDATKSGTETSALTMGDDDGGVRAETSGDGSDDLDTPDTPEMDGVSAGQN